MKTLILCLVFVFCSSQAHALCNGGVIDRQLWYEIGSYIDEIKNTDSSLTIVMASKEIVGTYKILEKLRKRCDDSLCEALCEETETN